MTKEELFKEYDINESHSKWTSNDSWFSVEIYRFMHNGDLPPQEDTSVKYITDFLDKRKNIEWWTKNVMSRKDWGNLFITSKRLVYSLSEEILNEIDD